MALRAIYILFEIPLFFDSPCRYIYLSNNIMEPTSLTPDPPPPYCQGTAPPPGWSAATPTPPPSSPCRPASPSPPAAPRTALVSLTWDGFHLYNFCSSFLPFDLFRTKSGENCSCGDVWCSDASICTELPVMSRACLSASIAATLARMSSSSKLWILAQQWWRWFRSWNSCLVDVRLWTRLATWSKWSPSLGETSISPYFCEPLCSHFPSSCEYLYYLSFAGARYHRGKCIEDS